MAGGGELGADLVGAAGEQLALYQDSPPAVRRVLYKVAALLPPGDGAGEDLHLARSSSLSRKPSSFPWDGFMRPWTMAR